MLDVLMRDRTEDGIPGGGTEHNPIFMASPQLQGTNCTFLWNLENGTSVESVSEHCHLMVKKQIFRSSSK